MVKEQHPTTCCIFPFALIDIPSYSSRLPPEAPNIKRLTPSLKHANKGLSKTEKLYPKDDNTFATKFNSNTA
jgi:hypothetical protein